MTPTDPSLEELVSGLANLRFFVVFMQPTDAFRAPSTSAEAARILTEHLLYLSELQRIRRLYASGPIGGEGEGMCILRTDTLEDAEQLAYAEPYHRAGWRTNTVRSWQLNEGLLVEAAKALTERPR